MQAKLTSNGRIIVPKSCRDALGLKAGAVLEFKVVGTALMATKVERSRAFSKWRGKGRLPGDLGVDDYLALARSAK